MTTSQVEVAAAIMRDQDGKFWGYRLMKETGVRSGVLYPILDRMLVHGWLIDGWEDEETARRKHVRRRYYELTDVGKRELGALLAAARTDARFRNLDLGLATS